MKKLLAAFILSVLLIVPVSSVVIATTASAVLAEDTAPAGDDAAVAAELDGVALPGEEQAAAPAAQTDDGLITRMADAYQKGGWVMHIIAITLALAWAITFERAYYLFVKARANKHQILSQLVSDIEAGKLDKAHKFVANNESPMGKILAAGLDRAKKGDKDYADAMDQASLANVPFLERNTPYLGMIGNVATLLGLLGTILGLIGAFGATAYADPAQKATMLSLSISEAMNTTAFGLLTAIPALVLFSVLNGKTQRIIEDIQEASSIVIDKLNKATSKA